MSEPKCRHKRKGIVKAGEWTGAHASTAVCDRPECIADAIQWVERFDVGPARFIADASRNLQPSLLDSEMAS